MELLEWLIDINDFPLDWNVIPAGKNKKYPLIKWDEFKERKYPRTELLRHDGNLAVICGSTSNNLFVIDLDYKGDASNVLRTIAFNKIYGDLCKELPELAKTRVHKTPHGHHLLYYLDHVPKTEHIKNIWKGEGKTRIFLGVKFTRYEEYLDGVDIQGDKALAIIPPSSIGKEYYETLIEEPVLKLNSEQFEKLRQFFLLEKPKRVRDGFVDLINGKIDIKQYAAKNKLDEHVYWKMLYVECYWRLEMEPNQLFEMLAKTQPEFNVEKTLEQLRHLNLDKIKPFNKETYSKYFPDYVFIKDIFGEGIKIEENKGLKELSVKQLTDLVANMLMDEFDLITLSDSRQLMVRKGSYYSFDLNEVYKRMKEICDMFSKGSYNTFKSNAIELIKDTTLIERDFFCDEGHYVNFLNGVWDVVNEELIDAEKFPHPFFYCIPHDYLEGEYECNMFRETLDSWLVLNGDAPRTAHDDIFEGIGLCMSTHTGFKKAFLNFGPTNSGKTQFLNLLMYIVGEDNICSVKLHRLTKNEFGTRRLQNRLLNACGEIPKRKIKYTDLFKELTGDDAIIPCEIKGGNQFEFKNYAKFWFNANNIPPLEYIEDDAFFERFVLIEFPNQFTSNDENFKLQFWEQLTKPSEIQGIIHEAMKGLKRLIERKSFRKEIIRNTKHIWLMESDPVYKFINHFCSLKKGERILATTLYEFYNENGDEYLSTRAFTIELEKYGVYKRQLRRAGGREYYYINIELKKYGQETKDEEYIEKKKKEIDIFMDKIKEIREEE